MTRVTRRDFMAMAAAATTVSGVWADCPHATDSGALGTTCPTTPRLAFQVYAVRDMCAKDFTGTLNAAKAIGYEGVETGRFYGRDAKGLKAVCADAGLKLVSLQLYPHTLT